MNTRLITPLIVIIALVCLLSGQSGVAAADNPIHPDLRDALQTANAQGKLLLVDFYGAWCPWCVKMDGTLADQDVTAAMARSFYYYKLDVGHFDKHTECIKQYGVEGIPFIAVFRPDGTVLNTCTGYKNAPDFVKFLNATSTPPSTPDQAAIHPDLLSALKIANAQGKTLLVDFYGAWCPWCVKMDDTLGNKDVKAAIDRSFYYYKLDVGHFDNHTECLNKYGVNGIPCIIAFRPDGSVLNTCNGYKNPPDFVKFLAAMPNPTAAPSKAAIHPDLLPALKIANTQGKLLLVDFYGAWCPWCVKMDGTLADQDVTAAMARSFYYYKLDVGHFDKHTECIEQYGVKGIPFIAVFRADGTLLDSISGYQDAQTFTAQLKKWTQQVSNQ